MPGETYACYLLLGDDLDPEAVTSYVGIVPTRGWRKGDPAPDSGVRPTGGWLLESDLPRDVDDEEAHVAALMDTLHTSWQSFISLGALFDASLYVVAHTADNPNPAFNFDRSIVRLAADLNAHLGLDLYPLGTSPDA